MDITSNLENSRNCLRRIARHDEQQFSKDSIVNVMENFVKTVNIMDETILVPCRLMDRQVGDSTDIIPAPVKTSAQHHHHYHNQQHNYHNSNEKHRSTTVHDFLNSADLFNLYTMLNSLKNDLLWTRNDCNDEGTADNDNYTIAGLVEQVIQLNNNISNNNNNNNNINCEQQNIDQQQNQQLQQSQKPNRSTSTISSSSVDSGISSNGSSITPISSSTTTTTTILVKGHIRRPSTASMASSNSVSNLSDSESEISNENDSGIESEGNCGGSQSGGSTTGSVNNSTKTNNQNNVDKATELARQCRTHLNGLYRCLEQMTEAANYLTARYQSDIGPV